MLTISKKFIMVLLVSALALGSSAYGAALNASCVPKSCCCGGTDSNPWTANADSGGSHPCEPIPATLCCHFKPLLPKTEAALPSMPELSAHRTVTALQLSEETLPEPHLFTNSRTNFETERIRAPHVPIFLLTLAILC